MNKKVNINGEFGAQHLAFSQVDDKPVLALVGPLGVHLLPVDGTKTELLAYAPRTQALCISAVPKSSEVLIGTATSSGSQSCIECLDLSTQKLARSFVGHSRDVTGLGIFNNGQTVLSSSLDCTIGTWDIQSARLEGTQEFHSSPIFGLSVRGYEDSFWSIDEATLYNVQSGKRSRHSVEGFRQRHFTATFVLSRVITVSAADPSNLDIYKPMMQDYDPFGKTVHDAEVTAITSAGSSLLISGDSTGAVKVSDLSRPLIEHDLKHEEPVTSLAVSADGSFIAACGKNNISIWAA